MSESKRRIKVKKVGEIEKEKDCRGCRYYLNGVCIEKGKLAGIVCDRWEYGQLTDKELIEIYSKLKNEVDELNQRLEVIRKAIIEHLGTGSHVIGKYIVNVSEYDRKTVDIEKVKKLIEGKEDEFVKKSKVTIVKIRTIRA